MSPFYRDHTRDDFERKKDFLDDERGLFFFFRCLNMKMQKRFAQLVNHQKIPRAFIHGNPHVENYAHTTFGTGMLDFDRSRIGPYAYDIVRFLCSMALKKKSDKKTPFLHDSVLISFLTGYMGAFRNPEMNYKKMKKLLKGAPKNWEKSTAAYLASNKKWAKKLNAHPVNKNHPLVKELLEGYLHSRNELHLLEEYFVEKAGMALGSLGNQRILIVLTPKNLKLLKITDKILIEIKTVYRDPDNEHYFNPIGHHGLRMIRASELYAPGVETRTGHVTVNGVQYWGRQIPPRNVKAKAKLNLNEQRDLSFCVGQQLGRAHRLSLYQTTPSELEQHLVQNFDFLVKIGEQMNQELKRDYKNYLGKLGLEQLLAA